MKRAPQGRYTKSREFRQEAVKLVLEENLSLPEAGRRLSLPPSTLGYWVKLCKAGKLGDVGRRWRKFRMVVSSGKASARLRPANLLPALDRRGDGIKRAGPDEERTGGSEDGAGHPKKAAAYFARESLPGTR